MEEVPQLLTIADVAHILRVSEGTVRALVQRGHLAPPHKVNGRSARWFRADVITYLERLRNKEFS